MQKLVITKAIVIPSYGEDEALPSLLTTLAGSFNDDDVVIVADDSLPEIRARLVSRCENAMINSSGTLIFSFAANKSGRGTAVRRGMKLARKEFPNLVSIMECDADGSHQPQEILRMRDSAIICDLLAGSRYLKESQIAGWPITRRITSKILNVSISLLFGLHIKDITNGMRRYSIRAVDLIINTEASNSGFIYLTEQALLISRSGFVVKELPISFIDRELGSSTMSWREIVSSLIGIIKLFSSDIGPRLTSK